MWCRTWFDADARQTRRASLGTDDPDAAEQALAGWIAANVATRHAEPADATLGRIFLRYEAERVRRLHAAGATAQRRSLAMILQHVPEGATVAQFGIRGQEAARNAMQAAGYGPWTIKRAFGAAKASINWAWQREELARPVPFIKLEDGELRDRVLSVVEVARLWDADMPDHVRAFIAVMLATGARPDAAVQLTRFQFDLVQGVVNLNPAGRKQTKKRRPILPLASWLRPFIEGAEGHVVAYRGRPIQKIAGAFQTVRDAAGFGPDVTSYTLRHTVATELKRRGVATSDIAALLGHSRQEFRTTEGYIHVMGETLASLRRGAAISDSG